MLNTIARWIRDFFSPATSSPSVESSADASATVLAMANTVLVDIAQERRHQRSWARFKRISFVAIFALVAIFFAVHLNPTEPLVGVVRIEGNIMNTSIASAEKIVPALKAAFEMPNVKAVVLAIDSPGGAPVEAERINFVIDEMRAKHKKPVIAVIQNVGASAAYMISLHADKIYAGRYSMVGSVGAVLSSWDVHKGLARFDVYQKVYASGELKAMLNPFIPTTQAAEDKAQDIVNVMGRRFAAELHQRRGKLLQPGFKYDTGEIWDGEQALKLGLVDAIGTIEAISAQYGNARVYEFGPRQGMPNVLSSSIGSWLSAVLSTALRDTLLQTSTATVQ